MAGNVVLGIKQVTVWTDKGGCMHCKSCCYSPYDDPYCIHPKTAPKEAWPLGRSIESALNGPCKNHKHFEKRKH